MPPSTTEAPAASVGAAPEPARSPTTRALAWWLLVGGLVGLVAAFVLAVEKYALLADPTYVPSCSLNPVLSCGSVMASPQAEAFGFPNPLLGVAGFAVVAATGAALLAGGRLAVLTGQVGQAADGWVAADAGVGPMVVVGV
jgi:uncharacterized membrane protein